MPDSIRRLIRLVVPVAALLVIVLGLAVSGGDEPSDGERVRHLASRIICPLCRGESIADAPSQIARDLEAFIADEVASGRSDGEIIDYFVARYGESALVDPPLGGWGWTLWAAPVLALVGGGVAVARRRTAGPEVPSTEAAARERLLQIDTDLRESAAQVAEGDLSAEEHEVLAARYEAEAEAVRGVLDSEDAGGSGDGRPSARRRWIGAAVLVLGAAAATWGVIQTADDGGVSAADVPAAPAIDLESITPEQLEAVVARNPEIVGMRLALADLYFQNGDASNAVRHYTEVLMREENPEAMARIGYILWQQGEAEGAAGYLEEALERAPDYAQAAWWLANVRMRLLDDPAGAVAPLEVVLASDVIPDDVRAEAEAMLAEATS